MIGIRKLFIVIAGVVLLAAFSAGITIDPLVFHIDKTISPSKDFFQYANGAWFKANPIPGDKSSNGIFQMVNDSVNKAVREICNKTSKMTNAVKGSPEQKIGDFYCSGMDTVAIEKAGINDLKPELDKIDAISDRATLLASIGHLQKIGVGPFFSFYISRDDKISTKYAVFVHQGGLGLPDRDYYTSTDGDNKRIRDEYVKHNSRLLQLTGVDAAASDKISNEILNFETELAKASRKLEDLRDPYRNYNKMAIEGINKLSPSIEWKSLAASMGIAGLDSIIVGQPEFVEQMNASVTNTSLDVWKNYLKLQTINTFGSYMSKRYDDEVFNFYDGVLGGVKKQKPRWERVVEKTNGSLGELVGQIYVKQYLPAGTKEKMIEIGRNIMDVYRKHIQNLDWMSDSTKRKALKKLDKVNMKLGWPDKWRDYTALNINRKSYLLNVIAANEWAYDYMTNKYGKPVDLTEWDMTPQTYNAYYNPNANEIVIPACNIIVPGFKGLPDDAVLYAIVGGSTYGHEITHGFDDEGRLYDGEGNLHPWWSIEDSIKFAQKAQALISQFSKYTVNDSLHVNGKASLGENIADLGGVVMGYEAFKQSEQYKKGEKIGGLSPAERYFLGYAYAWMVQQTPQSAARRIMSDVHSPAKYRVIGPLADMDEFYKVFNITPGGQYYIDEKDRVLIW